MKPELSFVAYCVSLIWNVNQRMSWILYTTYTQLNYIFYFMCCWFGSQKLLYFINKKWTENYLSVECAVRGTGEKWFKILWACTWNDIQLCNQVEKKNTKYFKNRTSKHQKHVFKIASLLQSSLIFKDNLKSKLSVPEGLSSCQRFM